MERKNSKATINRADKVIRKTLLLIICSVVLVWPVGCRDSNRGIKLIVEGDGQFPEFLVGTWQPDESRWIFTFEPDGRISKFRHFGNMEFDVAEGGLVEQWRGGAEAIYALGPCGARYDPKTRELSVTIVIERYIIDFPNGSMEGSFYDYLTGPVSEDGAKWDATWTCRSEIIGSGSDETEPKRLAFTKATDTVAD